jgi:transcriptional regulator with XRE-family HTH domain
MIMHAMTFSIGKRRSTFSAMAPRPKPKRERGRHFFRAWREKVFPIQADAEAALGWSQSKVSRLENGETPYNQDDLELAAEVFGCTPADLITRPPGDTDRSPENQLKLALLAFGVDADELGRAISAVKVFVDEPDERSSQPLPDDQSGSSNSRRVRAPS